MVQFKVDVDTCAQRGDIVVDEKPDETRKVSWAKGDVDPTDLRVGVENSDSVRRLQHALKVEITGDYDTATRRAVRRWRLSNDQPAGRGTSVNGDQASHILGRSYTVKGE